ncbi:Suppressor of G2 allele of skp1 [Handroanthus impetiginosus]|uniref:Protein SGT1 homolog n=1 Tax=Handroanthus impetiginosus TaxID=429701 RepID=A0A2G9G2P8_9LAMI|nr:Suppressor of G2 allele of skp1 [Handroanthus impetiginosus]
MASSDLEKKAKEAFIDDHFELAVDLYSQAIALSPSNAELFADRAQANIKLRNFTEAVADANKAIELDPSMAKAYLRKGSACIKLEEYETAKTALEAGASLAPTESRFAGLIKECDERIAEEAAELPKQLDDKASTGVVTPNNLSSVAGVPAQGTSTMVSSAKLKYRHEYYQKPEEVVVTIFAKGIPANSIVVDFGEQILSVTIELPGEEPYHFQPRLFGKIIPAKCRYDVMSTKIEIRLAKADTIHWTSLEFKRDIGVVQKANVSSGNQKPTYPSSKPKRVDWDKLEAQVKKEEKDEKLDGDAALNKFFRDIYRDADEDTRRAMSKSFVESNGTVLSTNWKEVGSKKVEGSPPDGMEMKKWEY